jgi:AraC-like DNA-binding protein
MNFKTVNPDKSISLFVKNILVFEETQTNQKTLLPFFADGYPGLMFQETQNGLFVRPHNKEMPLLFLYGIIFQLYPFVLKSFFNVTAKDINDGCYDLEQSENGSSTINQLLQQTKPEKRIDILTAFLFNIFQAKKETLDFQIRQSIQVIIENKGQIPILKICRKINSTERTFERRFLKETGISPKQFSNMIRFQRSLEQITLKDFTKLTDVVYSNGYADQSHFIKVFKAFTGKTPKAFKGQK